MTARSENNYDYLQGLPVHRWVLESVPIKELAPPPKYEPVYPDLSKKISGKSFEQVRWTPVPEPATGERNDFALSRWIKQLINQVLPELSYLAGMPSEVNGERVVVYRPGMEERIYAYGKPARIPDQELVGEGPPGLNYSGVITRRSEKRTAFYKLGTPKRGNADGGHVEIPINEPKGLMLDQVERREKQREKMVVKLEVKSLGEWLRKIRTEVPKSLIIKLKVGQGRRVAKDG